MEVIVITEWIVVLEWHIINLTKEEKKYAKEIKQEMYLNVEEQYGVNKKLW